jgi:hypothetical protein
MNVARQKTFAKKHHEKDRQQHDEKDPAGRGHTGRFGGFHKMSVTEQVDMPGLHRTDTGTTRFCIFM